MNPKFPQVCLASLALAAVAMVGSAHADDTKPVISKPGAKVQATPAMKAGAKGSVAKEAAGTKEATAELKGVQATQLKGGEVQYPTGTIIPPKPPKLEGLDAKGALKAQAVQK